MEPFENIRAKTQTRLVKAQRGLEFQVDHLADNVHKLEQRVHVAGRQADKVLQVAATRLKQREDRERRSAGTRDMPIMEVLRSLGGILPGGQRGDG
jgi:kinetochore protein Mis13/DSN1